MTSPIDGMYRERYYGGHVEIVFITEENRAEILERTRLPATSAGLVGNYAIIQGKNMAGYVTADQIQFIYDNYERLVDDPAPDITLAELRRRMHESICKMMETRSWCRSGTDSILHMLGLPGTLHGWNEGYGEEGAKAALVQRVRDLAVNHGSRAEWLNEIGVVETKRNPPTTVATEVTEAPSNAVRIVFADPIIAEARVEAADVDATPGVVRGPDGRFAHRDAPAR